MLRWVCVYMTPSMKKNAGLTPGWRLSGVPIFDKAFR
ncbi:hypothetical protein BACCAP_03328 [Pseudoflavonifractor capillosus ATCC 29799]|uniref:Uncharacterized protein n=1 Tax=Pseudoflavonifractor capillosus ATCC 29799 TaxID=411467 RepID=A6NYM7_9FIRM|nr:hypothetical protein BACCAP_03328 [Pseudoflavonifractor capillosus ATCC 29799]